MKHATNGEVMLFKRPIEAKLSMLLTNGVTDLFTGLHEDEVVDFEFISNPQAIQSSVKNNFGYVRSRNSSGTNSVGSGVRQPPISRPTSSNSSSIGSSSNGSNGTCGNGVVNGGLLNSLMGSNPAGVSVSNNGLSNGLAQGIAASLGPNQGSVSHSVGNGLKEFLMEQQHLVS